MDDDHTDRLYDLADLIHAVARRLPAPPDLEPGPCTPIEINVMRIVQRTPGVSARTAADACGLPTSNFSRVLKGLVAKGLVERRRDPDDARVVHLHPTERTRDNMRRMREAWGAALSGAGLDGETLATVTQALSRIEDHLSPPDPATANGPPDPETESRRTTDAG
ncbi:MAG: MarR family winged helix-turn-helix transcriptional regulator [Pseudomonadota bacterium]|nr:MarR family winged helix-turn-helix transcriptional regulator [Pseudomonadota bacterium]